MRITWILLILPYLYTCSDCRHKKPVTSGEEKTLDAKADEFVQKLLDFDLDEPVSMAGITGREYQLSEVLSEFALNFEKNYFLWNEDENKIKGLYHRHLLFLNRERTFRDIKENQLFSGQILGVNNNGQLRVLKNEKEVFYSMKELDFRL